MIVLVFWINACMQSEIVNGWNTHSTIWFRIVKKKKNIGKKITNRYELILCSFTTKSFSVSMSLNYLAFSSFVPGLTRATCSKFCLCCGCIKTVVKRCVVVYECDLLLSVCLYVCVYRAQQSKLYDCIRSLTNSQYVLSIQMIVSCAYQSSIYAAA